ncbi:hypothetical protein BCR34DRAFT_574463 [Clohesyomyces aquaticus]|uniref:Uncharacterized protein n=1 Tax=Clohesyomyces aquaticus TaxID=1231657 RepID=A0A1Y1YVI6_9PLEO|nr:hypothetical protein BCR34DRAFT_574463 [Clohesyomyces aquaticus]
MIEISSPLETQLLRLPRELRNLIWPHVTTLPFPIGLERIGAPSDPPMLHVELLEAFYSCNTFIVVFPPMEVHANPAKWGPNQSYNHLIRHLIVYTTESIHPPSKLQFQAFENHCPKLVDSQSVDWTYLLDLPRLSTLAINLNKMQENKFHFWNFAVIIPALRAQLPKLNLKFCVSFDAILSEAWNDPYWRRFPRNLGDNDIPYESAGYIDSTEIVAPPSEDDKKYVEEFLPHRVMPAGPPIRQGLLACSVANRQILGKHYVVKEPALLRVLIEEHYMNYKDCKERYEQGELLRSSRAVIELDEEGTF